MAVNQKAVKVLNKVFEAGFADEKAIASMTMDDILSMQGITVADITLINDLQKSIPNCQTIILMWCLAMYLLEIFGSTTAATNSRNSLSTTISLQKPLIK